MQIATNTRPILTKNALNNVNYQAFIIVLTSMLFFYVSPLFSNQNIYVSVGVYENSPKIFTSPNGKPNGIFIDIIEDIAKQEKWNIKYVKGTWEEGLKRLETGEIDLMPDVSYSTEREKKYKFHKIPVLSSWSQIFARKGSNINSILDLNGKRLAILNGSIQQETLTQLGHSFGLKFTFIRRPSFDEAFKAVVENQADAAVTNNYYGLMHARKLGLDDTAVVFSPATLFFAASKNTDVDILNTIDKHLLQMKQDPESAYFKSLKKWTTDNISPGLPLWIKILGLILGIIIIVSTIEGFILRHQIQLRTKELRRSHYEMEGRIIERTAELYAAKERALQADMIKSAFLATMSHELRTPLNSIIGFTGILLQGLPGPLNQEQQKQLKMIQNSSRHLLSLINDVLDISKIEAGQLELFYAEFNLKNSFDKMLKTISPLAEKKGLHLKMDIQADIENIYSDQRRLEQVILNLLSNAVKFSDTGTISLSCHIVKPDCIISVSDTGIGISPSEIENLFIPFNQVDNGLTRKYEGTGLGLSICKKLIEMMHGSISVESIMSKGSIFTIRIPIKREEHK